MELVENGIEFFKIDSDYEMLVSKCGKFKSIKDGRNVDLITRFDKKGYLNITGYSKNKYRTLRTHRLLALAFIPKPEHLKHIPFSNLQVNHIDGVKHNNALSNLEWVTGHENVLHAHKNFLHSLGKIILARNIKDGTIKKFNSLTACGDYFGIERKKLSRHLKSKDVGKLTKDWHVFKFDDGKPWPEVCNENFVESKWEYNTVIFARNETTGKEYIFENMEQIYNYLNLYKTSFRLKNIRNTGFKIKVNDVVWYFKKFDNMLGLNLELIYKANRRKFYSGKKIKVTNFLSNKEIFYDNLAIACARTGFSEVTLRKLINTAEKRNGFVYSWA
jgi:hypothetical protein